MINFDGEEVQEEFNEAFLGYSLTSEGDKVDAVTELRLENLTAGQIWWLVKFAKHIRGRCHSNTALNNYLSRNFPQATFREVPKEYNGKSYMGLQISVGDDKLEEESE